MFNLTRFYLRKGNAARDRRDWPKAKRAFAAVLQRRPDLAPIWVQYGHALKETGAIAEALEAYRQSDRLLPSQADTQLQIGRALYSLDQPELARDHLEQSAILAGGPSDADLPLRNVRAQLRQSARSTRPQGMPERLRFVNLGTTGTCNASCVHCPTGKAETSHVPRGTMPMELFKKIVDGIVAYDLSVTDQVAFGLFGDGLVDPLVVERADYLRQRLPDVSLSINTNGAAFSHTKHAQLKDLANTIALHCESLEVATYNDLMRPLRLERVKPKIEQMMETYAGKVVVSVPISRRNRDEASAIRQWFMERGARDVVYDPLSSRCAEDRTVFDSLALAPREIRCPSVIMDDLIVDCDGQVLICCQDFQRIEGIGNLVDESFADVLVGLHRHNVRKLLDDNRHIELATCRRCYADIRGEFIPT